MKSKITITIMLIGNLVFGQKFDNSLIKRHSAFVVQNVWKVSQLVRNLDSTKLSQLASFFDEQESLLKISFSSNKSDIELYSFNEKEELGLKNILGVVDYRIYSKMKQLKPAELQANFKARYLMKKYNVDSLKYYSSIYAACMASNLIEIANDDVLDEKMSFASAKRAEKLYHQTFDLIEANYYFKAYADSITKNKSIANKQMVQLEDAFNLSLKTNNHFNFKEHFLAALHQTINDTAYYTAWYSNEVFAAANTSTNILLKKLTKINHIGAHSTVAIRKLIFQREKTNAVYNIIYPNFNFVKDSLVTAANNYYDSLLKLEYMKDGEFEHVSLLSTAIKMRYSLKLRKTLADTLVGHCVLLDKIWNDFEIEKPWGKFDFAAYEMPIFDSLLTEEQIRLVLKEKNKPQAEEWVAKDWKELLQRDMVNVNDSNRICRTMMDYNINMLVIKERYANDQERMWSELNGLNINIPDPIARLKKARTLIITKNESKEKQQAEKSKNSPAALKW